MTKVLRNIFLLACIALCSSMRATEPIDKNRAISQAYINRYFSKELNTFEVVSHFSGKHSEHLVYAHWHKGYEVIQSYIYFHFYPNHEPEIVHQLKEVPPSFNTSNLTPGMVIKEVNGQYYGLHRAVITDKLTGYVTVSYSNSDTTFYENGSTHKNDKDTTIFAKIFYPNPVVTRGKPYADPIIDNNDSSNFALELQQRAVPLLLGIDSLGLLYYKDDLITFTDISFPKDLAFDAEKLKAPINRSMFDFETANVYFHIHNFVDYLDTLGYRQLAKSLIIDPHGFNGEDNSAYSPYGIKHSIQYGTGGVDDAEDAQVIIHEYSHSLIQAASPYSRGPVERNSIEEGIADYLCMTYSNRISGTEETAVFSWDGHNEFFQGFDLHSKKNYKTQYAGNSNKDREIWSSVLYSIYLELGYEVTNTLVMEHLFYLTLSTIMPTCAESLLDIDQKIYNGQHANVLMTVFKEHGIYPMNRWAILYQSEKEELSGYVIQNTLIEDEQYKIILNKEGRYELSVYRLDGQKLYSTTFEGYSHDIKVPIQSRDFMVLLVIKDANNIKQKPLTFKMYNRFLN